MFSFPFPFVLALLSFSAIFSRFIRSLEEWVGEDQTSMASPTPTRISFRILILIALMVLLFYVGRPLYWKISATIHDIRHNKQSVREGNTLSLLLILSYLSLLRSVLFGYRYISDRTRGAEIGGMVSRRVGLWDLRGS